MFIRFCLGAGEIRQDNTPLTLPNFSTLCIWTGGLYKFGISTTGPIEREIATYETALDRDRDSPGLFNPAALSLPPLFVRVHAHQYFLIKRRKSSCADPGVHVLSKLAF